MDIIDEISLRAEKAADQLVFDIIYIPGEYEFEDRFKAENKELAIFCYGVTEESALLSAKQEATAKLMNQPAKVERLIKHIG